MIDQTHALIAHLDVEHLLETGEVKWSLLHVDLAVGREGIAAVQAAQAYHKRPKFRRPIEGAPCDTTSISTLDTSPSPLATAPAESTSQPVQTAALISTFTSSPTTSSERATELSTQPGSRPASMRPSGPPTSRDALRARIAELVAAGHESLIRAAWPHGVAPLSKPGHTADDLALILTAVRRVESDVSWPFRPDDGTVATPTRKGSTWPDTTSSTDGETDRSSSSWPAQTAPLTTVETLSSTSSLTPSSSSEMPSSTETTSDSTTESDPEDMPPASPAVTDESPPRPAPQLPDEGGDVDPATVAALQAAFAALPDAARQAIGVISAEANAAGRPISVTQSPTLRRWSIARALVAWGQEWVDDEWNSRDDLLWFRVGNLLDSSQVTDDDTTLGALIGALTIEQANALHDTFDITVAA